MSIDTSLYRPPLSIFLEFKKAGYADTLVQLSAPPVSADIDVGRVIVFDPKIDRPPPSQNVDWTRAAIGLYATDCNGQSATRTSSLTWLDADDTTITIPHFFLSGGAMVLNLPINAARVTRVVARVAQTNQLIATASVVVRPGAHTWVRLPPAP
jgi:hypothetical protein